LGILPQLTAVFQVVCGTLGDGLAVVAFNEVQSEVHAGTEATAVATLSFSIEREPVTKATLG
jgi:hypothetical protein